MEGYKKVSFDVQGEFITKLAREQFFYEGKSYEATMDLLLSCMEGTEQSHNKLLRQAEDVLIGRAALVGSTREGTYHMEMYEPGEQQVVPDGLNIFLKLSKVMKKLKETESELHKMQELYAVAMEYVPSYKRNNVLSDTGQPIECRYGDSMLNSYMERMMDEAKHATEDYGWLKPDGTFYEVEWGNHQEWASNYVKKHFPEEFENVCMQINTGTGLIGEGDWLVEQGWVLLHSPSQGIAIPTRNPIKRYTKAQQEFLYDYYIERGKDQEANAIYDEVN